MAICKVDKNISVTLVLSLEEALVLRDITGKIIGDSNNTPRKYTDAVYYTLDKELKNICVDYHNVRGSLYYDEQGMDNFQKVIDSVMQK